MLFQFAILLMLANSCFSQQINYFSDCFYGSVTGGGYNPVFSYTTGTIDVYVPPGSTIRKAFLFTSVAKYTDQINFGALKMF